MSTPLSEQVAELEATAERQKKQIVWLDIERERLATENAELRKESDTLWEVAKHVTIPSEHIRIKGAPLGDYSAPAKDVDTYAPSLKENGENFTRPLTVHQLNVAPVGSVVANPRGVGWRKLSDGSWVGVLGLWKMTSTEVLMFTDDDATITYPEDQS